MAKKLIWFKTHQSVYLPGVGECKNTFPPDNKTLTDLEMVEQDNGSIHLTFKVGNIKRGYTIGAANVIAAQHDMTPVEVAPVPAKK